MISNEKQTSSEIELSNQKVEQPVPITEISMSSDLELPKQMAKLKKLEAYIKKNKKCEKSLKKAILVLVIIAFCSVLYLIFCDLNIF